MKHTSVKSQLEKSILHLENLLNTGEKREAKYQEFFEQNSIVIKILGYSNFQSFTKMSGRSLPRDKYSGLKPEPDFIVERDNGLYEIFEIKTPISKKLRVDSNKYRERFTAEVCGYISQTITYEKYFTRNPENRKRVQEEFEIDIHEDLDIKIVIGLTDNIDKVKVHQQAREYKYKIDIITYDEVLRRLLQYHKQLFGIYEGLPGFSFHFIIRLHKYSKGMSEHFFDIGKNIYNNRISFYLSKTDDICFDVIDNSGKPHQVSIDSENDRIMDQWMYVACEFGRTPDGFTMIAGINGDEKDIRIKNSVIELSIPFEDMVIGCNLNKSKFGYFDIAEQQTYSNTLSFREKNNLLAYFLEKYDSFSQVKGYVQFNGNHYLVRNRNGDFVQDQDIHKPIYRSFSSPL